MIRSTCPTPAVRRLPHTSGRWFVVLFLSLSGGGLAQQTREKGPVPDVAGESSGSLLAPTDEEVLADVSGSTREHWFGVYFGQHRIGWLRETWERSPAAYCQVAEFKLRMKVLTGEVDTHRRETRCYGAVPPFSLVTADLEITENRKTTHVRAVATEEGIEVTTSVDGSRSVRTYARVTESLKDVLPTAVRNRMKPGDRTESAVFDLMEGRTNRMVTTLKRMENRRTPGGTRRIFRFNSRGERGLSMETLQQEDGVVLESGAGPLFKVIREDKDTAQSMMGEAPDMFLAVSVPTTGALDANRAQQVQSMVVRLTAPPGFEFQPRRGQTLEARDGTRWTIRIDACPSPDVNGDTSLPRFTSCTPEYPCDVEWIRQLATGVSGGTGEGVLDRVLAVSRWIHQEFRYELAGGDLLVERVLKERKGDCLEYSKAMVTLLRALEVPARLVSGLVPAGSDPQVFGFHAWVQAWIPGRGWVYFDPTWGTHPVDASHIALEQDNSLQSTSSIGALSLEILEVNYGTAGTVPTCP